MDTRRRDVDVDEQERPREALWLARMLADEGHPVSPEAADRLLVLHRAYLEAPPPDDPEPAPPPPPDCPPVAPRGAEPGAWPNRQSSPTMTGSASSDVPPTSVSETPKVGPVREVADLRRVADPECEVVGEEHPTDVVRAAHRPRPNSGTPDHSAVDRGPTRRRRASSSTVRTAVRLSCRHHRSRCNVTRRGVGVGAEVEGRAVDVLEGRHRLAITLGIGATREERQGTDDEDERGRRDGRPRRDAGIAGRGVPRAAGRRSCRGRRRHPIDPERPAIRERNQVE